MNKSFFSFVKPLLPLMAGCIAILLFCPQVFRELRIPDPPKSMTYQYQFTDNAAAEQSQNMRTEGFRNSASGLALDPDKKGICEWSIQKEKDQGCLLRIWLYGAPEHPSTLSLSVDSGKTYAVIADNKNHVGKVLDINDLAQTSTKLLFRINAKNHAPYPSVISDRLDIYIGAGPNVVPPLPDMAIPCAVFLLLYYTVFIILNRKAGIQTIMGRGVVCCIIFAAFYLRWNETARLAGTALDGDALSYLHYARIMDFFSPTGFFSAQFGMREPMYLFIAKATLALFGFSETHLRFVSCVFSVFVIILSWQLGKKWLNEPVGLLAAAILVVHPYLIELSGRGLREEMFTCLLLLLLNAVKKISTESLMPKTLFVGLLIGALLLTRSETHLMILAVMVCLVLFGEKTLNWRTALISLSIGIILFAPHLYNTYRLNGNIFNTMNIQARFYANMEFAGRPGFPTKEELAVKGLCSGPSITPFEYFFKLHTPWELAAKSAMGFCKTTFAMPFSFASSKGNQSKMQYSLECMKNKFSPAACGESLRWLAELTIKNILDYCIAVLLALSFIAGIVLLIINRQFFICSCLVTLQLHTSFIASFGIDQRLTVHAYPVTAICCAYALHCIGMRLHQKVFLPFVHCRPMKP
jgi:4-amino-4-deoxy-L-arabinose transferase-like glycosyltransferase